MGIEDGNYRLRPSDFGGLTVETFSRALVSTAGATSLTTLIQDIPRDRILVLKNISGVCEPGSGQTAVRVAVNGITAAGATFNIFRDVFVPSLYFGEVFNWQGEVAIRGRGPGETSLSATGLFDLSVEANFLRFAVFGYIIPRANVAEF